MDYQDKRLNPWEPHHNLDVSEYWQQMHDSFVRTTNESRDDIKAVFIGDSIVHRWVVDGKHIWDQYYAPKGSVNYGIDGDTIQNVLWRVVNRELDGLNPKIVVLQCGTNNMDLGGHPSEEDIARGIQEVVKELRHRLPNSKLILMAIKPITHPSYATYITRINELIATNADNSHVFYFDLTEHMIDSNGKPKRNLFTDGLHLSANGYSVWHECMRPLFERLIQ